MNFPSSNIVFFSQGYFFFPYLVSEAVCLTFQDAALWRKKAAFLEFVESEMPACNMEEGNVCCGW